MKQNTKIKLLLLSLLCLAAVSCSKENPGGGDTPTPVDPPVPEGEARLFLPCETLSGTKTYLDGFTVKWKIGDRIAVNGKSYYVTVNSDGSASVNVPKADSYEAFYPEEILDSGRIFLQRAQYCVDGSVGRKANPSYCRTSSDTLEMKSLCGILHLTISGTDELASICVSDNAGEKLCGSYSLHDGSLEDSEGISAGEVTLNCKNSSNTGVRLDAAGKDFYIVLPEGTYGSGLSVNVSSTSHKSVNVISSSPLTLARGHITDFPEQISFAPDEHQIYSLHFDNMTFGGDPVGGKNGFRLDSTEPKGFEYGKTVCGKSEAGCGVMATTTGSDSRTQTASYYFSRNITDFKSLQGAQEFAGYMGTGVNGNSQGAIKLPAMSNIPAGKVCKAVIEFKMAFQSGHSDNPIGFLHTYSSSGKILGMWIDGEKVADCTPVRTAVAGSMGDDSRWSSQSGNSGITAAAHAVERVLVKPSDFPDFGWHSVRLEMGAVTPTTVIEIHPQPESGTGSAFFIDDIEAKWEDYELPSQDKILPFSYIISPTNTTALTRVSNFGSTLGITKYIDISIGTTAFLDKNNEFLSDSEIKTKIAKYIQNVESTGYKVWNIHLPATDYSGSYDSDVFEYFDSVKTIRQAAVEKTKKILQYVKGFHSVNLMIHATGRGRYDFLFEENKDYGVASFQTLVDYCNSSDMEYPDGSHPVFCIENIQNKGTTAQNVCAKAEYMNYYCSKVPGLKVCYDSSHAQVCEGEGGESAMEYLRILGTNVACVHMHGNGRTNKDCHIMPGYKDGLGYSYGLNDIMDWGQIYKILIEDCKYKGVFTYEGGTSYKDQLWGFCTLADNYYGYILPLYLRAK